MIESLLNHLQEPAGSSSPDKGYGFMVMAISASAVYRKTTTISLSAADDSSALTLVYAGVERVKVGFLQIHKYWANAIEVALACWLLQRQIGAAFVAPIIVVIVYSATSTVNSKFTGKRQKLWMVAIQQRAGRLSLLIAVDITIPSHALSMIVGPVASGKSTLLRGLPGETLFTSGDVVSGVEHRRLGYCGQSPFLYNDTIKASIVAVNAAMPSTGFATLPKGDRTRIRSNSLAPSGGQRQQVALARALYLETDLLILADVLSSLDATTEEYVFRRVFSSDGSIRQRGATAVLCTHSVWHLPMADHIIALKNGCTVVEQGLFADLRANGKYTQSLKIQDAEENLKSKADTDIYPAIDPFSANGD
ncbi:P-loop containing nucleoside triphosphate hydrolase protein [Colletotrichum caudatum]|nr:P-loop containing nucleoside triphosphate hydrolase protein [Colletotrichum caudatum]